MQKGGGNWSPVLATACGYRIHRVLSSGEIRNYPNPTLARGSCAMRETPSPGSDNAEPGLRVFSGARLLYCGDRSQQPGVECDISTSSGVMSVATSAKSGVLR